MTRRIEDRNLLRMQEANALMARLDRFFRDVHDLAAVQGLAIFLDEKVGLCLRPKIVVVLADHRLPRPTEQVFTCAIEPHEPQRLALLDEQHEGNVFDDGVEGCVGSLEFSSMRLRSVMSRTNACQRPSGRILALTSTGIGRARPS